MVLTSRWERPVPRILDWCQQGIKSHPPDLQLASNRYCIYGMGGFQCARVVAGVRSPSRGRIQRAFARFNATNRVSSTNDHSYSTTSGGLRFPRFVLFIKHLACASSCTKEIDDQATSRPLTAWQSLFRPVANNALNSHRVCTIIEVLASFVNTHMHLHMQPLRWMSGWCATKNISDTWSRINLRGFVPVF